MQANTNTSYTEMLSGIFPSITTPFTRGEINFRLLESNMEKYNDIPLGGYMILGGNGEYLGLTPAESRAVVETICRMNTKKRTIVAGVGRESAYATIEFIKSIAEMEVDIASVITPFYFSKYMDDRHLIAYFTRIADESPLPILIYNSPVYASGIEISTEAIGVLSKHSNIVGMKNSSTKSIKDYSEVIEEEDDFAFHSGKAVRVLDDLKDGAVGATLSMAIYMPELCSSLYENFKLGNMQEAEEVSTMMKYLNENGPSQFGVPGVKYAMDSVGLFGGEPRLPLLPLSEAEKEHLNLSKWRYIRSW